MSATDSWAEPTAREATTRKSPDGNLDIAGMSVWVEVLASWMPQSIATDGRIGIERSLEFSDANGSMLLVVPFWEAVAG